MAPAIAMGSVNCVNCKGAIDTICNEAATTLAPVGKAAAALGSDIVNLFFAPVKDWSLRNMNGISQCWIQMDELVLIFHIESDIEFADPNRGHTGENRGQGG